MNRVLITRLQASRQFLCHRLFCALRTTTGLNMQLHLSSPCNHCHCRWCAWCQAALWRNAFKPVQPPVSSVTRPPALACRIMTAAAVGLVRCAATGSASSMPKVSHWCPQLPLHCTDGLTWAVFLSIVPGLQDMSDSWCMPTQTATQPAWAPASSASRPLVPAGQTMREGVAVLPRCAAAGSA